MPATPLRVLYVEDQPDAVELLDLELCRAGFAPSGVRVDSRKEFLAHLDSNLDVILSDYTMPGFSGLEALRLMQEQKIDVPFICVSGTLGEELAVAAMQEGASDYLMKDRLARLGSAVKHAMSRFRLKKENVAIEKTAARLAAIVESSADAIIAITLDGVIVAWNTAAERLYGYPAPEIIGKDISVLIPEARRQSDLPENHKDMAQRLRKGELVEAYETVRVCKDHRRVDISVSISPVRDSAGLVVGASFIAQYIGRRKRAERLLAAEQVVTRILTQSSSLEAASPSLLQALAEAMRWEVAVLWKVDSKANVLRRVHIWHASWAEADFVATLDQRAVLEPDMGIAGRAWTRGEPVWDFGSPAAAAGQPHGPRLRGAVSIPMRHGGKMVGAIEFYCPELHQPDDQMLAALDNIISQFCQFSERLQGEAALRASEARYRTLIETIPHIVWMTRPDGLVTYLNQRGAHYLGILAEEFYGWKWLQVLHPDDRDRTRSAWEASLRSESMYRIEYRVKLADGMYRWVDSHGIPQRGLDGKIENWIGTWTDIEDQKKSFEELRRSENRFRDLVTGLPTAVYTTDQTGCINLFNEQAVKLWGRRPSLEKDRWCGSCKIYRSDGTPLPFDQCPMARTLQEGRAVHGEEIAIERPDGSRSFVLPYPELLRGAEGEIVGAVNVLVDVTQLKQLENQLRQSQKMDAIGQLAAGVAHDFNNMLTIINGYSDILRRGFKPEERNCVMATEILRAGERAAGMTRQLPAFSRQQILNPQVINLNVVLADSEKMLRRLIGEDVELKTIKDPALANIKADPGQVEQILLNLAVNARHAMPNGGKLTITTENVELNHEQLLGYAENKPGAYVMLTISDTGCGMDKSVQAKIFEPFFTTKGTEGTGLGLATVFGIVQQSSGIISVSSEPGQGATFKIYLPRVAESVSMPRSASNVPESLRGSETILLVEDEEGVRTLARIYLQANGYNVLEAADGEAAIRLFEKQGGSIDLLVTDVVMPRMSGRELTDQLVAKRPDLKVLYLSGYTTDAVLRHGVSHDQTHFLQKPFSPVNLALKVRETLNAT